jgi:hypothetical protein
MWGGEKKTALLADDKKAVSGSIGKFQIPNSRNFYQFFAKSSFWQENLSVILWLAYSISFTPQYYLILTPMVVCYNN